MHRRSRYREPSLDELLREPIVKLLMLRDGVDAEEVRTLMHRLALGRSHEPALKR